MEAERVELKARLDQYRTKLQISDEKLRFLEQDVKTITDHCSELKVSLEQALNTSDKEKRDKEKLQDRMKTIENEFQRMKDAWSQMEQTMSCLSCLEYLGKDNPWTLLCGHSICNKVSLPSC